MYESNLHHRQSTRLKGHDYSGDGKYFITICTKNREEIFGDIKNGIMILNRYGTEAKKQWLDISTNFPAIIIDEFIIMPNHLHGIIEIDVGANNHSPYNNDKETKNDGTTKTVGSIIRNFKIGFVKWMTQNADISTVWQRNFHDHIIRNDENLNRIREYIINNPINWDKDKYFIVR